MSNDFITIGDFFDLSNDGGNSKITQIPDLSNNIGYVLITCNYNNTETKIALTQDISGGIGGFNLVSGGGGGAGSDSTKSDNGIGGGGGGGSLVFLNTQSNPIPMYKDDVIKLYRGGGTHGGELAAAGNIGHQSYIKYNDTVWASCAPGNGGTINANGTGSGGIGGNPTLSITPNNSESNTQSGGNAGTGIQSTTNPTSGWSNDISGKIPAVIYEYLENNWQSLRVMPPNIESYKIGQTNMPGNIEFGGGGAGMNGSKYRNEGNSAGSGGYFKTHGMSVQIIRSTTDGTAQTIDDVTAWCQGKDAPYDAYSYINT